MSIATSIWPLMRKELNKFQKTAISLACNNHFTLIQGPPGTGKTVTGAHLAYALAMILKKEKSSASVQSPRAVTTAQGERVNVKELKPCVMYCTPSNYAANVVLDILTCENSPVKDTLKIIRVFSKMIEEKVYSGPHFHQDLFKHSKTNTNCEKRHKPFALHEMIRKCEPEISKYDRRFQSLQTQGKIPSQSQRNEYISLVSKTEQIVLQTGVDIILCTCNEASSYRLRNSLNPVYCIVDECAMATEPECMVPISSAEHVILIGDHQQLSPIIKNKEAEEMGLSTSLFLRYVNDKKGNKPVRPLQTPHMLRVQYRMHTELCKFPSKEFYNGQLQTDHSIVTRQNMETRISFWPKGPNKPFVFCHIVGKEGTFSSRGGKKTDVAFQSRYNSDEANKIASIIKVFKNQHQISAKTLAVITPYSAQKEEITRTLNRNGIKDVTVKTITESQGSEYGIVIFSTVRSRAIKDITDPQGRQLRADIGWQRANLGFVTDRNRICVGITRCKYGLVIVGNKTLLSYDETWRRLIDYYQKNDCVVRAESFPPGESRVISTR